MFSSPSCGERGHCKNSRFPCYEVEVTYRDRDGVDRWGIIFEDGQAAQRQDDEVNSFAT